MLRQRPSLFIGSSSEGLAVAEALQQLLDRDCDAEIWVQGDFDSGNKTPLEFLVAAAGRFDFAVLLLTPDDSTVSREQKHTTPRDNVIFELGLFMGALGRNRTFALHDRNVNLKLPSDLAGVIPNTYQLHASTNLRASLGSAATSIKKSINEFGIRPQARLGQSSDQEHQGIRMVRPKYKFEPDFWLRVLAESNSTLDIIGNALSTWSEELYAAAFESQIKKILVNGGRVRLGLLDPAGPAHLRLKRRHGIDYTKRISQTLQFVNQKIVLGLSEEARKRLHLIQLTETDLPYMAVKTDLSVLVAPYFSQNDSKRHGIMMVLDKESQFGTGFLGDIDQIFASGTQIH